MSGQLQSAGDRIRLGISTCPNDTFAFHALMHRCIDWRGLDFQIELLDIQQLNQRLFAGEFDVAKTSFHAALLLADQTTVLPVGAALGFGVGPLLLASAAESVPGDPSQVTLCPGAQTTAALLFAMFYPHTSRVEHCVFSEILPRLKRGEADFGVCIHEGRFTWQDLELHLVEDLGTRWESETSCPLPLGGLVANRRLPAETIARVHAVIRESLEYSLADPQAALPTMRSHAQEFDDRVLMQHVALYVNDWTRDLGSTGREALSRLSQGARSLGLLGQAMPELSIWTPARAGMRAGK
jgi:1,4-dihydroxy-6-naphthoate synthase